MAITLSSLRTNLYTIVDEAISTGIPVEITRNGHKVRLVPERKAGKLGNLKRTPQQKKKMMTQKPIISGRSKLKAARKLVQQTGAQAPPETWSPPARRRTSLYLYCRLYRMPGSLR